MNRTSHPVVIALLAGVVFGFGLALAQMTDPTKIKDFLDFTAVAYGGWDPSLAFVMAGALAVAFPAYRYASRMESPLAARRFNPPTGGAVDVRLVGGSILFGIGWGLAGLCPGPAIADLAVDPAPALIFVAAMFAGSWLVGLLSGRGGYGAPLAEAPSD